MPPPDDRLVVRPSPGGEDSPFVDDAALCGRVVTVGVPTHGAGTPTRMNREDDEITEEDMLVLDPPVAASEGVESEGFAARRDWWGGHEFVCFRPSYEAVLTFALVDQQHLGLGEAEVRHEIVPMSRLAYEVHAGRLCRLPECPHGTPVTANAWARIGGLR